MARITGVEVATPTGCSPNIGWADSICIAVAIGLEAAKLVHRKSKAGVSSIYAPVGNAMKDKEPCHTSGNASIGK